MSDFITHLVTELKQKKGVTDTTAAAYLRTLIQLNDRRPFTSLAFLRKKDAIDAKIAHYAESTQKTVLGAITSVLSLFSDRTTFKTLHKHYYEKMMSKAKEQKPTGEKSEKQKENWIEWKDVVEKNAEQRKQMASLAEKKSLTQKEMDEVLQALVLSLYVCIQPRRNQDYLDMVVVKKWSEELPKDKNYLDLTGERFIFNKYKTAKKYGKQEVPIPVELLDVLVAYLKHHPFYKQSKSAVPFLINAKGEPLTAVNSITRLLNKMFKKKLGSSMLRHIFLTDKYGEQKNEMAEDAEAMGHSVAEQQNIYVLH